MAWTKSNPSVAAKMNSTVGCALFWVNWEAWCLRSYNFASSTDAHLRRPKDPSMNHQYASGMPLNSVGGIGADTNHGSSCSILKVST
ncbi:hypothetical protein COLO4_27485 [Corchorus olitorius]|uniref:Uncharacterized protein n=1 Tax=Corchorus olitorius TaxID=93759 RepID=A0A1R3HQT0_9ROSI|nr:hypothetical protein COLO4_27485 [Corchorus olitorius]